MNETAGSKPLKNTQHEAYCQYRLQRMSGDKAYEKAGYKLHAGNPVRLDKRPDIQGRISWLQAQAAKRAVVTVNDIADQLDNDRAFARKHKKPSAMVQSTMGKAKVLGLVIQRHIVGQKRIEDMNELELRALLGILEAEKEDAADD